MPARILSVYICTSTLRFHTKSEVAHALKMHARKLADAKLRTKAQGKMQFELCVVRALWQILNLPPADMPESASHDLLVDFLGAYELVFGDFVLEQSRSLELRLAAVNLTRSRVLFRALVRFSFLNPDECFLLVLSFLACLFSILSLEFGGPLAGPR